MPPWSGGSSRASSARRLILGLISVSTGGWRRAARQPPSIRARGWLGHSGVAGDVAGEFGHDREGVSSCWLIAPRADPCSRVLGSVFTSPRACSRVALTLFTSWLGQFTPPALHVHGPHRAGCGTVAGPLEGPGLVVRLQNGAGGLAGSAVGPF